MAGRLDGKVCVVTGTGGSMGRATALAFAREGGLVVGCDVAVEPAEETVAMPVTYELPSDARYSAAAA